MLPQGKKKFFVISSRCASLSCTFTETFSKMNILKEVPFLPLLQRFQTPCPSMLPRSLQHLYHSCDDPPLHCFYWFLKNIFLCHLSSALLCCFNKLSHTMSPHAAAETSVASFFLLCKKKDDRISIYLR